MRIACFAIIRLSIRVSGDLLYLADQNGVMDVVYTQEKAHYPTFNLYKIQLPETLIPV
jgi:hypothetical protein